MKSTDNDAKHREALSTLQASSGIMHGEHTVKKYTDKEEEYISKLMAAGMDRKGAEHFLDIMQTVAPGDINKGLGCIRREPRWMK